MKKYLLLLVMVVAIAGCSEEKSAGGKSAVPGAGEQRANDSLALKVGVRQTIDCLPAFVAKDEGIFDSLNVDVRLWHFTSMLDCNEALKKRKLNGAFTDVRRVEYLNRHYGMGMHQSMRFDTQWRLVANRMSRLKNLKQLQEKTVAMSRNSATDYLCDKMADSVKLGADRVFKIQINDVDLRLKMLLNNEIDAVWLTEPQLSVAKKHGDNVLMTGSEKLEVLAFTGESVNDARVKKQIDSFVRAYEIAKDRIKKRGEKYYRSLIEKYYKYNL